MNSKDREIIEGLTATVSNLVATVNRVEEAFKQFGKRGESLIPTIENEPTKSTGNVFEDMGFPKEEAVILQLKTDEEVENVDSSPAPARRSSTVDMAQFTMDKPSEVLPRPVNTVDHRENIFVDNESLHKDQINATPEVSLSSKGSRPKFERITQNCTRCNKAVKTHPQHARELFTCDNCLRR
tara:strand:+ start:1880 stop:2428 length:549 start_codon:yes stop_codon:yes gene_type:complete